MKTSKDMEVYNGKTQTWLVQNGKDSIFTLGGPIIMPVQWVRVISSSLSSPQEMVPSPTPFCPCSSSSRRRKFRGTTGNKNH